MLTAKRIVNHDIVSVVYNLYNLSISDSSYVIIPSEIFSIEELCNYAQQLTTNKPFVAMCLVHDAPLIGDRNFLCFWKDELFLLIARPCYRSVFSFYTNNPEVLKQLTEVPINKLFKEISALFLDKKKYKRNTGKGSLFNDNYKYPEKHHQSTLHETMDEEE